MKGEIESRFQALNDERFEFAVADTFEEGEHLVAYGEVRRMKPDADIMDAVRMLRDNARGVDGVDVVTIGYGWGRAAGYEVVTFTMKFRKG